MNHRSLAKLLSIVSIFCLAAAAHATALAPFIDLQEPGLTVASGGVGLLGIGAGTRTVTVNIGGPVRAALLYWAGRDRPCPLSGGTCIIPSTPYKDQVLRFDGNLLTGTIIGTEAQPLPSTSPINNIGYFADVTAIVAARGTGAQSFNIQDGNLGSNLFRLNGATLLVLYTNPADTNSYRVLVFDGLDFAYGQDPSPGPTHVTVPVTFSYAATGAARTASLLVAAGDAEAGRPDRIDISDNPSLVNTLDGSAGLSWDSDTLAVSIPAGVGATTVQLFSEPVGSNPDSLLWELASLRVPLPSEPRGGDQGCTPGYWKNHTGSWAGTGYAPGQTVGSVFSAASGFPSLASETLLQALQGGGGPGTLGAAKILLRAGVAALLNASSSGVDYPRSPADVISEVNAALASNDRDTMLTLASALDADNNLGCPLN